MTRTSSLDALPVDQWLAEADGVTRVGAQPTGGTSTAQTVDGGTPRRLILAASAGGHLEEMLHIAPQLGASEDSLWVVPQTPQSTSLLRGQNVLHLPDVPPRDPMAVLRAARLFRKHLAKSSKRYAGAVSTGAALAVAVLPVARAMGLPARYIESFARFDGPSLTGRLLERVPGIRLTSQPEWSRSRWENSPMLLNSFESYSDEPRAGSKLFVTVGTLDKYPFNSLIAAVERACGPTDDTTWQIGAALRPARGIVHGQLPVNEFDRLAREADVVVCHAGVGTLLRLWQHGIYPIVVPRRQMRGEHVDDHQLQVATLAQTHDLGLVRQVDELLEADFETASTMRVRPSTPQLGTAAHVRVNR